MAVTNFLTLSAAVAAVIPSALGHGWMAVPAARQLPECNDVEEVSQVISGGGTGGGVSGLTLGGEPGLCGDPFIQKGSGFESRFVDLPCQGEREEYTEGGVIDMEWWLTANHGGHFQCNICDQPDNLSRECFEQYPLLTTSHNNESWYIMTAESSRVHDINAGEPRGHTFAWGWHLPEGLTCEHCVLQCTWWSGTHCLFPCDREICDWYADQYNHIMRPEGQSNYQRVTPYCPSASPPPGEAPQMFRNCGDIRIVAGDGTTDPTAPLAAEADFPEAVPEAPAPMDLDAEFPDESEAPLADLYEEEESAEALPSPTPTGATDLELEIEEEIEEINMFSPAGNDLTCSDKQVNMVVSNTNKRRSYNGASELECNDAATGAATAWAEEICAQGEAISDHGNNCRLANMSSECSEMVALSSASVPFDDLDAGDMNSLRGSEFVAYGVGYAECDDGQTAWVLLLE